MKKGKKILGGIILVLGIAAIGAGLFLSFGTSNKKMFTENLKRNLNSISVGKSDSTLNKALTKYMDEKIVLKLNTETTMMTVEEGNPSTQKISGDFYLNNGNVYTEFKMMTDEVPAGINLKLLLKDDRLYQYVENLYSKFYYEDVKISTATDVVEQNEPNKITDAFIEGLIAKMDETAFTKENAELNLGGKNFVLEKLTVNMTEKEVFEILMKAYEELDLDTADVKDMVEGAADSKNTFVFSIYLDGKDILSTQVELNLVYGEETQKLKVVINSYTNTEGFANNELILKVSGMDLASIKLKGVSASKTDITLDVVGMFTITGFYEETDTKAELAFQGNIGEEKVVLEVKLETVAGSDSVNMTMKVEMGETIKLNSINTLQIVDTFPEVDVSNAAPISEMSELEKSFSEAFAPVKDLLN